MTFSKHFFIISSFAEALSVCLIYLFALYFADFAFVTAVNIIWCRG
jgi:hypothetical protein